MKFKGIKSIKNNKTKKSFAFLLSLEILAVIALIFYVIVNSTSISSFIGKLNGILMPILVGVVIAYLCNPILNFFEYKVFCWKKDTKTKKSLCRGLSIFMTIVTAIAIMTVIILLIVPQLIDSLTHFVLNYETYLKDVVVFINNTANNVMDFVFGESHEYTEYIVYEEVHDYVGGVFTPSAGNSFAGSIEELVEWWKEHSNQVTTIGMGLLSSLYNVLKNGLLGIFIAFYLLASKELRSAQIKKFRRAVFSDKQNTFIDEVVDTANRSFGGFIRGKLVDSLIIGLLSYVVFEIFNVSEYNILIASFIGITNVIPVFGPFIGAIPSAVIVFISNPSKVILFIILILIIQQLDGNVIGPKILGDSTQVSSLTVIIAITIMGSIMGVFGMLIGVPVFATIITLVKKYIESRLAAKGEPTETENYFSRRSLADADSVLHREERTWLYKYRHSEAKVKIDYFFARFKRKKKESDEDDGDDGITHGDGDTDVPEDVADFEENTADCSANTEEEIESK